MKLFCKIISLPTILLSVLFFLDAYSPCYSQDVATVTKITQRQGRSGTGFQLYAASENAKYNMGLDADLVPDFKVGDKLKVEVSCIFRYMKKMEFVNKDMREIGGKDFKVIFLLGLLYAIGFFSYTHGEKVAKNMFFVFVSCILSLTASVQLIALAFRI